MILKLLEKTVDKYFALMPRKAPSLTRAEKACLIAHRGAHQNEQGIRENTLTAFRKAQAAGCWGLELDVHATADNIIVVNHDPNLKRLWGHNVAIGELTFTDLRVLAPEIPTLEEVTTEFGKQVHLFIELKTPVVEELTLTDVLHDLTPGTDYHLLTLNAEHYHSLSYIQPSSLLLVASHNNVRDYCELSLNEGYGGVLGHYLLFTNDLVQKLKEADQYIGVGFIDSKYSLYRELTRGINWIFSNQALTVSAYLHDLSIKS